MFNTHSLRAQNYSGAWWLTPNVDFSTVGRNTLHQWAPGLRRQASQISKEILQCGKWQGQMSRRTPTWQASGQLFHLEPSFEYTSARAFTV